MVNIKDVLMRLSDSKWPELIGDSAWNVIDKISGESKSQQALVDFALEIHGPVTLIRDKNNRKIIFRKLEESEAQDLVNRIGRNSYENPIKSLTTLTFCKGSSIENIIFDFFEIPIPVEELIEQKQILENVLPEYPLFNYQKSILLKSLKLIATNERFLIHMPTGSGKTRVAMNIIARLLMEFDSGIVLWLAYSGELCDQASDEFSKAWSVIGDREISLARFYGKNQYLDVKDGLIVASLGKLRSQSKEDITFIARLSKKVALVVFDEAHQSIAPTYMSMIEEITTVNPQCKFIGLSATPGRTYDDIGTDLILSKFFNSNKVTMKVDGYNSPITYLIDAGYLAKPKFTSIKYDGEITKGELRSLNYELDLEISEKILERIGLDNARNLRIIKAVKDAVDQGHNRIILFAASVESAEFLSALLKYIGIDSMEVSSTTESNTRAARIERFKSEDPHSIVMCNYGVFSTGFDAPKTTAVVIARPTKSLVLYSQMVGRALRGWKVGGTHDAEIITIIDTELPGFGSVVEAFSNWEDVWIDR
jgi:DNA repair protein RadD